MIVDPDFLDHWRTRMLVDSLGGNEIAPMYVIRIWGHCQQRKGDSFEIPAAGLKALCKATEAAEEFETALIDSGFISRQGESIKVNKWAEKNASLIAAWENGNKGGRPPKKPSQNPWDIDEKPTGNPDETHGKPSDNPDVTDKIREEKKKHIAPRFAALDWLLARGVDASVARDWLLVRKAKKSANTETAFEAIEKEAAKINAPLSAAIQLACSNNWCGFKSSWPEVQEWRKRLNGAHKQVAL